MLLELYRKYKLQHFQKLMRGSSISDHGLGTPGTRRRSPDNGEMHTKFTTSDLQNIPPALPATDHPEKLCQIGHLQIRFQSKQKFVQSFSRRVDPFGTANTILHPPVRIVFFTPNGRVGHLQLVVQQY